VGFTRCASRDAGARSGCDARHWQRTEYAPPPPPAADDKPPGAGRRNTVSDIYDIPVKTLQGKPSSLGDHKGKALLVVNVASRCGLTPQYTGLQKLQDQYGDKGFTVLGFPCNQFLEQEPGTADEIAEFCSVNYGVTFPLFEKIEVNGPGRHPLYDELTATEDADGAAGDIQWNFEKFLISPEGEIVGRFRPAVEPEDAGLVSAVEASLPG
jgi:glutathione peroxidase